MMRLAWPAVLWWRVRLFRRLSWTIVRPAAWRRRQLGHPIILLTAITSNPVVRIRLHTPFFWHWSSLGYPDFELFISRSVVEVAVLVLVEDVDDVRIVGADYMIVDDYLVLIYGDRLPCFIIAAFKDVQNISWNIIIRLRALNLIDSSGLNLRLGVNPGHCMALLLVLLGSIQGDEAVL